MEGSGRRWRSSGREYTLPAGVSNLTWTDALSGAAVSTTSQIDLEAYGYVVLKK